MKNKIKHISQFEFITGVLKKYIEQLKYFSFIFMIAAMLSACKNSEPVGIVFNESVDGQTVRVAPNEDFSIKLNSNPTTGFKWEWRPNDTEIIKLISSKYEPSNKDQYIVGSGGIETFVFKTIRAGIDEIELVYHRSWEKDVPPAKTVRFVVDAR